MAKEDVKVKGREDVKVKYTDKAVFSKEGEETTVHRIQAEKLVSKGFAKIVK